MFVQMIHIFLLLNYFDFVFVCGIVLLVDWFCLFLFWDPQSFKLQSSVLYPFLFSFFLGGEGRLGGGGGGEGLRGVRMTSSDQGWTFSLLIFFFLVFKGVIIFIPSSSTSHWMPVLMCLCAGAACHGLKDRFHYSVVSPQLGKVTVYSTKCT